MHKPTLTSLSLLAGIALAVTVAYGGIALDSLSAPEPSSIAAASLGLFCFAALRRWRPRPWNSRVIAPAQS